MKATEKLFKDLVNGDEASALETFKGAIQDKFDQAMAVKRVAISSEVFNQPVEESTDLVEKIEIKYTKGKSSKKETAKFKNQNEFEKWLGSQEDEIKIISHKGLKD